MIFEIKITVTKIFAKMPVVTREDVDRWYNNGRNGPDPRDTIPKEYGDRPCYFSYAEQIWVVYESLFNPEI